MGIFLHPKGFFILFFLNQQPERDRGPFSYSDTTLSSVNNLRIVLLLPYFSRKTMESKGNNGKQVQPQLRNGCSFNSLEQNVFFSICW